MLMFRLISIRDWLSCCRRHVGHRFPIRHKIIKKHSKLVCGCLLKHGVKPKSCRCAKQGLRLISLRSTRQRLGPLILCLPLCIADTLNDMQHRIQRGKNSSTHHDNPSFAKFYNLPRSSSLLVPLTALTSPLVYTFSNAKPLKQVPQTKTQTHPNALPQNQQQSAKLRPKFCISRNCAFSSASHLNKRQLAQLSKHLQRFPQHKAIVRNRLASPIYSHDHVLYELDGRLQAKPIHRNLAHAEQLLHQHRDKLSLPWTPQPLELISSYHQLGSTRNNTPNCLATAALTACLKRTTSSIVAPP